MKAKLVEYKAEGECFTGRCTNVIVSINVYHGIEVRFIPVDVLINKILSYGR